MPTETNIAEDAIFKSIGDLKKKIQLSGNNLKILYYYFFWPPPHLLKYFILTVLSAAMFLLQTV